MGESLIYSWLRHVKDCKIVQANWKPSKKWDQLYNDVDFDVIIEKINSHFFNEYGLRIFKKNSFEQILNQAEIDVLGISFEKNVKLYAVDVAFHLAGLNYGTKNTLANVIKKCARSAMVTNYHFKVKKIEIIFATPRIDSKLHDRLKSMLEDLYKFFPKNKYEFKLISNSEFKEKILWPTKGLITEVSDTSELFMRGMQLHNLFESTGENINLKLKNEEIKVVYNDLKVGKIVNIHLRKMLKENEKHLPLEILTSEKSNKVFGIPYPLLVEENSNFEKKRYYVESIVLDKRVYYICNEWKSRSKVKLLNWMYDFSNNSN